jgi:hypothetical protein
MVPPLPEACGELAVSDSSPNLGCSVALLPPEHAASIRHALVARTRDSFVRTIVLTGTASGSRDHDEHAEAPKALFCDAEQRSWSQNIASRTT